MFGYVELRSLASRYHQVLRDLVQAARDSEISKDDGEQVSEELIQAELERLSQDLAK